MGWPLTLLAALATYAAIKAVRRAMAAHTAVDGAAVAGRQIDPDTGRG
jgi:hypothetical protein